ncbi:MAG: molybdopterin-guanine dinucleotide biosynthesis protein B [Deltaproteobacteria bacterium]|jgi:molybdopterin-guanine dinucleotide biosynthesis protein B|nr:molybdopterin-guanine dinucleotide biosynthesis protein B [Deltaproteobacteria bacterium]MBW2530686.1 molybdopterin-guanine dinucleotide biosynthesis protein B [Deltaproteobacteria bacterium]
MSLALGIAGYSGAGKTTLIEALLPRLAARGLRVGVIKHDAHKLTLDREGKDTARFFAAGAAVVCAHDPGQHFVRTRAEGPSLPSEMLVGLPADLDFVLVEGHKDAPLPKLVLDHRDGRPAIEGKEVLAALPWGDLEERVGEAERLVVAWLEAAWAERPVGVVVLVGGKSRRMGVSKALLDYQGRPLLTTLVERLNAVTDRLVLAGEGPIPAGLCREIPRFPDAPCARGPMAGLLAVMRHDPSRAWLAVGCDQPEIGSDHARWLMGERRPGVWAVMPQLPDRSQPEPLGAMYEPPMRAVLERACARGHHALFRIGLDAPNATPTPPAALRRGWLNANTPDDWKALTGSKPTPGGRW